MSLVLLEMTTTSCKPIETLDANMVCARFEISVKTLWRWQKDAALAFPEPFYLQRGRYWPVSEIVEWEARTFGVSVSIHKQPATSR
ncbi:hypothetical protein [Mesorhizobium sp.]|uniref:helix-turn-helix transcriptional regulator n=1 Tax=Mesorhizobium sp. TaxID=1871066 RepID=UPI000FEA211D|nr:hypothetical protein [Mesorhizobium sp.]RWO81521.1 MAG: hypothetical protein EOQ95_28205 [Mesorhizobium sp.]